MNSTPKPVPVWILIITGIFALLEVMVSMSMCFASETMMDNVDHSAKGVGFLFSMWGVRQFALGVILGYAVIKRSVPMLTLSYIFLLAMVCGDLVIGIAHKDMVMIVSSLVMSVVSSAIIYFLNKKPASKAN